MAKVDDDKDLLNQVLGELEKSDELDGAVLMLLGAKDCFKYKVTLTVELKAERSKQLKAEFEITKEEVATEGVFAQKIKGQFEIDIPILNIYRPEIISSRFICVGYAEDGKEAWAGLDRVLF